jgi:hypothetical protein
MLNKISIEIINDKKETPFSKSKSLKNDKGTS